MLITLLIIISSTTQMTAAIQHPIQKKHEHIPNKPNY